MVGCGQITKRRGCAQIQRGMLFPRCFWPRSMARTFTNAWAARGPKKQKRPALVTDYTVFGDNTCQECLFLGENVVWMHSGGRRNLLFGSQGAQAPLAGPNLAMGGSCVADRKLRERANSPPDDLFFTTSPLQSVVCALLRFEVRSGIDPRWTQGRYGRARYGVDAGLVWTRIRGRSRVSMEGDAGCGVGTNPARGRFRVFLSRARLEDDLRSMQGRDTGSRYRVGLGLIRGRAPVDLRSLRSRFQVSPQERTYLYPRLPPSTSSMPTLPPNTTQLPPASRPTTPKFGLGRAPVVHTRNYVRSRCVSRGWQPPEKCPRRGRP